MDGSPNRPSSPTLHDKNYMIIYRYNSKNQADPVVRRRQFSILTLDEILSIHLPVPPSQLQLIPQILPEPQASTKRIQNEYLLGFRNPLISAVTHLPKSSFSIRSKIPKPKPEKKSSSKNKDVIHTFTSIISPQPISTLYNAMPAKRVIRIASQPALSRAQKFGKSVTSLQKLIVYQDTYRASLKSQELRRLPPRKRLKIWDTLKYDFRMI